MNRVSAPRKWHRDRTVSLKKVVPLGHLDGKNHVWQFWRIANPADCPRVMDVAVFFLRA